MFTVHPMCSEYYSESETWTKVSKANWTEWIWAAIKRHHAYRTAISQWRVSAIRRRRLAHSDSRQRLETSSFDLQTDWWPWQWACPCRPWLPVTTCSSYCHASRRHSRELENLRHALVQSMTVSRNPRCTPTPTARAARTVDLQSAHRERGFKYKT